MNTSTVNGIQEGQNPDTLLKVKQVAGILGVHPNTVRAWADMGELDSVRLGPRRDRRVRLGSVQNMLGRR